MPTQHSSSLFRKQALEKLQSPEKLDEVMHLTSPMHWLALAGITLILGAFGAWSWWGSLPTKISGSGILIRKSGIYDIQSPVFGRITKIYVQDNDLVLKNAPLAEISPLKSSESSPSSSTTIRAFHEGRILESKYAVQEIIQVGSSLFSLEVLKEKGVTQSLEALTFVSGETGKKIQPGMSAFISPDTVNREEFGYVLGKVTRVSHYPASRAALMKALQNDSIVESISHNGPVYEVAIVLSSPPHQPGELIWTSSKGPNIQIKSGTLCTALVLVETHRPIELALPFLKKKLGF